MSLPVCMIVTKGTPGNGPQVPCGCRLNGVDVPGVKDVMMVAEAGEPVYVTLKILVSAIGFEAKTAGSYGHPERAS